MGPKPARAGTVAILVNTSSPRRGRQLVCSCRPKRITLVPSCDGGALVELEGKSFERVYFLGNSGRPPSISNMYGIYATAQGR